MLQKVVIIGAGPAGLLLGHYLLSRGNYQIEIYERRQDPRLIEASNARTFPISLQERGRKALREMNGLEEAITAQSTFCQGTIVYRQSGKYRRIPRKNPILSIDRNRLVTILLQHLTEIYSSADFKIQFGCQCIQVDGTAKTVTLQPEEGDSFVVKYNLLVGADGAQSVIREYLMQNKGVQCEQNYIADAYKSVFINRCNPIKGVALEPDKIHSWNLDNKTRMILVPQPEDRLSGTIIFDAQNNPLEGLSTKELILKFFLKNFPIAGELMTLEDAEALCQRPVARVLTVRCDRFHDGDSILLIGDAAHAVSPSIGQGCNASLEDVLIVGQLLDEYEDDWGKMLPAFSRKRVPDAHALRELSDYSFPRNQILVLEFFWRLTIGRFLHKWFPGWSKPFVFDLVLDTDLSYSEVLKVSQGWINKVKRSMPQKQV